jgi:hypothetical protein
MNAGYIPEAAADMVKVLTPMPRWLAEASRIRANEMGISRSELIRRLLGDYLENE